MLNKFKLKASNIRMSPLTAISLVLSIVLILFGIYVIIPADWLGIVVTSVYPSQLVRSLFGGLMMAPAIPILYWNIKYDLNTYLDKKHKQKRPYLFWMGVTYFYLAALRIAVIGLFPPIALLYIALGLITMILWMER